MRGGKTVYGDCVGRPLPRLGAHLAVFVAEEERLPVAEAVPERRDVGLPEGERDTRGEGVGVLEDDALPERLGEALLRGVAEALREGPTERLGDALPDAVALRAGQRVGLADFAGELHAREGKKGACVGKVSSRPVRAAHARARARGAERRRHAPTPRAAGPRRGACGGAAGGPGRGGRARAPSRANSVGGRL
jgi:hypothetical protein